MPPARSPPTARRRNMPKTFDQTAHEAEIVSLIQRRFPTFGGESRKQDGNPLTHWLADKPAQFALGVDVAQVVRFVITAHDALRTADPEHPTATEGV